jgi:uncharacterized repeat protein (TIGR03803 family)
MRTSVPVLILLGASTSYAQSFDVIYTFPNLSAGYSPTGLPYIGPGGVIFGGTVIGGACNESPNGCGTIFSVTPPAQSGGVWTGDILYTFHGGPDGANPGTGVIPGPNGTLLGTTWYDGAITAHCPTGCGTFFQLTPTSQPGGAWTKTTLYDFLAADYQPHPLLQGIGGVLYDLATLGGNQSCFDGCGSVYELQPPVQTGGTWTRATIFEFQPSIGYYPMTSLVTDASGVLYGTASQGGKLTCGAAGCGTVFSLTPPTPPATNWTVHDIYQFVGGEGGYDPSSGLVMGADGTLYGTTYLGGSFGYGTVFSLTPPAQPGGSWIGRRLYAFKGGSDGRGSSGYSTLAIAPDGVLYGDTRFGGGTGCDGLGCGVLYQLTPPLVSGALWSEKVLHAFSGGVDGSDPTGITLDPAGVLYGFASGPYEACCGVVFQYVP